MGRYHSMGTLTECCKDLVDLVERVIDHCRRRISLSFSLVRFSKSLDDKNNE